MMTHLEVHDGRSAAVAFPTGNVHPQMSTGSLLLTATQM
jgi:hypothetical protein